MLTGCADDSTGPTAMRPLVGTYELTRYLGLPLPYVQEYTTESGARRRDVVSGATLQLWGTGDIGAVWRGSIMHITGPDAGKVTAYADTFWGNYAYSAGANGRGSLNVHWMTSDTTTQWQPLAWRSPELLHYTEGMTDTTRFRWRR